jgi:4-amino-4-deoxy-L-arabinose transferase-like glycosyltransferase
MRADLFSPSNPLRPLAAAFITVAIVLGGALLYTTSLGHVPPYLIHDEAQGALQAHAIATTGRDLTGRWLPMYFTEPEFPPGRDPVMVYVTALGLRVLPFTEAGARTPTALVAVLNLALMFFAARAIFQNTWAAVLAAVLLALTPIHFIRGRLLLSPLYSIPFILGWLWALGRFAQQPTARRLIGACVWLALGMYSYLAAVVMMPLYLLMTIGVAPRSFRRRSIVIAVAVFVVCLLPMAAWYFSHPERNAQIVSAYRLTAAGAGSSIGIYWRFFDPSYLFVSGDPSLVNSTRTSGLFPLAFAALLPIGLVSLARTRSPINLVVVAGFLTAPVASVISGGIEMNRVMFVIPFAVLVATGAVISLVQMRSVMPLLVGALLVVSIAWQFALFHRDYMSDRYRVAAAPWFSGNVREAARELIGRAGDEPIYVSREIDWVERMWRFYAIQAGRLDLVSRTTYVTDPPATAPPGAWLLCPAESGSCTALGNSGAWHERVRVPSIGGARVFVILQRAAAVH